MAWTEDGILANPFLPTLDAIEPILIGSGEVYAKHRVDWNALQIVVYLTDSPSSTAVQESVEVAARAVGDEIPILFETAPVALAEIARASSDLFGARSEWSPDPTQVYYAYPDVETATIHVGIGEGIGEAALPATTESFAQGAFDVEYSVEPEGTAPEAGSRINDLGGWTGGNWMHRDQNITATGINSSCTMGFTWRLWNDPGGVYWGGTAQHCIEPHDPSCDETGNRYAIQYHNGRQIGTSIWEDESTDSALLYPADNTSFNATVWVGGPSTTTERNVVAASGLDAVDNVVALSAARHGPPETITAVHTTNVDTCAGIMTATDGYVGRSGDSGGPWLTTYSNGTVRAHGQHYGRTTIDGLTRSLYVPVVRASAGLEASIVIVP